MMPTFDRVRMGIINFNVSISAGSGTGIGH